jgi:hypothetical protein
MDPSIVETVIEAMRMFQTSIERGYIMKRTAHIPRIG